MLYGKKEISIYNNNQISSHVDSMVREEPLTLYVNGNEHTTLVCSPQGYRELAIGHLFNEGLLQSVSQIKDTRVDENKGMLWIDTFSPLQPVENPHGRFFPVPAVGDFGFAFRKDALQIKPLTSGSKFSARHLLHLISILEEKSGTFRLTGGVHSAGLADDQGILVRFEDIGRHNAVDKVIGYALWNQIPLNDKILVLSGRVASEILVKVARCGIPLLLSRSAAMLTAVKLAEHLGICVVGFARGQQFNIYSHQEMIGLP